MIIVNHDDQDDINDIDRRIFKLPPERQAYMRAILEAMDTDAAGTTTGEADRLMDMMKAMKPLLDD